ncbi:hypothetical protein MMC21_002759 [Puttea exsequens]|nr:hypothetical protein [Puttea exsequens]
MSIVNTKDQATIPPAEDKKLLEEVTEEQEQKMAEAKGSKEIGNRGSRCVWATSLDDEDAGKHQTQPKIENSARGSGSNSENRSSGARGNEKPSLTPDGLMHTADLLQKAVEHDTLPKHLRTREHYGFPKVNDINEELNLLGSYNGLFKYLKVSTNDIYRWQRKNTLARNIINSYGLNDSGYLRWFKKNRQPFDQKYVRPGGPKLVSFQGEKINVQEYTSL